MNEQKTKKRTTAWLCTTAMFMALNIAMSSFGVPGARRAFVYE